MTTPKAVMHDGWQYMDMFFGGEASLFNPDKKKGHCIYRLSSFD